MPHEVIMPALGMAQDTGLIVAWRKAEGEKVAAGDVLFEVETDKATMEVEAQAAGYLTGVSAAAGQDVPVGTVIALIADSADAPSPSTSATAAPAASEAPAAEARGKAIIMPALGMAQDTGLLVSWHKAPGDAVAADDILFEVETDKSTVEVPAGVDGYLAALHANPGDEVPVGETIAIVSAEKPANPVQTSRAAGGAAPATTAPPAPAKPAARPAAPAPGPALAANGRILASPKARRLALEQGLDLARLAAAGHPQPFHSADLDRLRALPAPATATASGPLPGLAAIPATAARRLTADLPADGFREFATWAAETAGLADSRALLAGLAAASLGRASTVAVETLGRTHLYSAPLGPLHAVAPAAADAGAVPPPDLILRDLRAGSITTVALGAEAAPVLTLTRAAAGLQITLECAADQLTAAQAVALLDGFAGRIAQPLRHLL